MPSNFGRIHKAAVLNNEYTNLQIKEFLDYKFNE